MKDTVFVPKAVPSGCSVPKEFVEGTHVVYEHLHFDIQQELPAIELRWIDYFIKRSSARGKLSWENFRRIPYAVISEEFAKSKVEINTRVMELLADPALIGSPTNHLTAKYAGLPWGKEYRKFSELYKHGLWLVDTLPNPSGYIERELISFRVALRPEVESINREVSPSLCPIRDIQKVPLASLGRHFRTTEIHITFEYMHKVSQVLLGDLFSQGFYTAFRYNEETKDYGLIATIQGFDPEIGAILVKMHEWLKREIASGSIACEVVIKKEDIRSFCVFGPNPKIQEVVKPGSII